MAVASLGYYIIWSAIIWSESDRPFTYIYPCQLFHYRPGRFFRWNENHLNREKHWKDLVAIWEESNRATPQQKKMSANRYMGHQMCASHDVKGQWCMGFPVKRCWSICWVVHQSCDAFRMMSEVGVIVRNTGWSERRQTKWKDCKTFTLLSWSITSELASMYSSTNWGVLKTDRSWC